MNYSEKYINEDIKLAKKAISETKLDMTNITGELKYELYCIPSHNHYCYFAQILSSPDKSYMIYARTEIDDLICGKIFMYPFSEAVKRNKSNRCCGKIICGMREISCRFKEYLCQVFESIPHNRVWQNRSVMIIDGIFQMIRMYENGLICKEFAYFDCQNELLDNLYELVETEINGYAL